MFLFLLFVDLFEHLHEHESPNGWSCNHENYECDEARRCIVHDFVGHVEECVRVKSAPCEEHRDDQGSNEEILDRCVAFHSHSDTRKDDKSDRQESDQDECYEIHCGSPFRVFDEMRSSTQASAHADAPIKDLGSTHKKKTPRSRSPSGKRSFLYYVDVSVCYLWSFGLTLWLGMWRRNLRTMSSSA